MPDFKKISETEPLSASNPLPVGSINRAFAAITSLGATETVVPKSTDPEPRHLLAKNSTGGSLSPGKGVSITGVVGGLPASTTEHPLGTFDSPLVTLGAAGASGVPATTIGPIPDATIGQVLAPPCAVVLVNISNTTHTAADAAFASATSGPWTIIQKATAGTGSQWCLVAYTGSGAAGPPGAAGSSDEHGVARLTADLLSPDVTGSISGYKATEGSQPSPTPTTATNPYSLSGTNGQQVIISKRSGSWAIAWVFDDSGLQNHGVAQSYAGWTAGDALVDIKSYRSVEGTGDPGLAPATINNPYATATSTNDWVIVSEFGGSYEVVAVLASEDKKVALDAGDDGGYLISKLNLTPTTSVPSDHYAIVGVRNPVDDGKITLYAQDTQMPHATVRVLADVAITFEPSDGVLKLQKTFIDLDVAGGASVALPPIVETEIWRDIITTFGADTVGYRLRTRSAADGPEHTDPTTDSCGSGA